MDKNAPLQNSFEFNLWSLNSFDTYVQNYLRACYNHDYDYLINNQLENIDNNIFDSVTPLHFFATGNVRFGMHNSRAALQLILKNNNDFFFKQDYYGWLPINYAAWFSLDMTLDLLLEAGSPVHHNSAPQPLDSAFNNLVQNRDEESAGMCVKLLLMHGANPEKGFASDSTYGGISWLAWALIEQKWEWVEALYARSQKPLSKKEKRLLALRGSEESIIWAQRKNMDITEVITPQHELFNKLNEIKCLNKKDIILREIYKNLNNKFGNLEDKNSDKSDSGKSGKSNKKI